MGWGKKWVAEAGVGVEGEGRNVVKVEVRGRVGGRERAESWARWRKTDIRADEEEDN